MPPHDDPDPQAPNPQVPEPRAVTFDAAGTLFQLRRPVGEVYAEVARRHGWDPDDSTEQPGLRPVEAELDRRFGRAFAAMPPLAFPEVADAAERRRKEREWWRRLVDRIFAPFPPLPDFDAAFDELYELYGRADAWKLFPDAAPTLERLSVDGLRLGVVTNFDSRIEELLDDLGIGRRFADVVFASAAGAAKPDPVIFEAAAARLDTAAGRTLHVGDDPREDLEGARRAGLRALLLDRQGRHAEVPRKMRLSSLHELLPRVVST